MGDLFFVEVNGNKDQRGFAIEPMYEDWGRKAHVKILRRDPTDKRMASLGAEPV